VKLWRLEPLTFFGIVTASLLAVFPVVKGTSFQPVAEQFFIPVWLGIIALRFGYGVARSGTQAEGSLEMLHTYSVSLAQAIHKSQLHVLDRTAGTQAARARGAFVEDILNLITQAARLVTAMPSFVDMRSNLMEPTSVMVMPEQKQRDGLTITHYDRVPQSAAWTSVAVADIGAGATFRTGRVEVVEDTHEPIYSGALSKSRARCWASFPVTDADGNRLAVVNVDASSPYVLTKDVCRERLTDVLTPYLKLLSEVIR
jgi:GAF domain-containing protein